LALNQVSDATIACKSITSKIIFYSPIWSRELPGLRWAMFRLAPQKCARRFTTILRSTNISRREQRHIQRIPSHTPASNRYQAQPQHCVFFEKQSLEEKIYLLEIKEIQLKKRKLEILSNSKNSIGFILHLV
jgi:hypothetical protein